MKMDYKIFLEEFREAGDFYKNIKEISLQKIIVKEKKITE